MKKYFIFLIIGLVFLVAGSKLVSACEDNTCNKTDTRTLGCDTGYTGSITETRYESKDRFECKWGDWKETSNTCTIIPVKVDGGWSDWSEKDNSCGYSGTQTRTCTNPSLSNGGADCVGDSSKTYTNESCSTPVATISATKIVCPTEDLLPNWGAGGPNITSGTASAFLTANPTCHSVPWTFEWAPKDTLNPGDQVGVAGGAWTSFTGTTTVPSGNTVWVREQFDNNYIPFTGVTTTLNVSAELYCNIDVLNFDNYDRVDSIVKDNNYYCIGFNVLKSITVVSYTVTASAGDNGTITPASQEATSGTTVNFTVTPNSGYTATVGGTCTAGTLVGTTYTTGNITADCTVEATFTKIPANSFILTVETLGTGTGVFTGAGTYTSGTVVTLTATPSDNSTFDGWSENCPGGIVTLTSNITCTATFTLKTVTHHSSGHVISSGSIPTTGQVLGAETTCGIYIDKYMRMGLKGNDPIAVKKVQIFLNSYMDSGLLVDGVFGPKTDTAVRAFQTKQFDKVLAPWELTGSTGIFYLTTQTEVNNIMCPSLNLPIPALIPINQNPAFPQY